MKKFLSLLLCLMLALSCCAPASAETAEEKPVEHTSGEYTYILLSDGTAEITSYSGEASKLTVPSTLDGYTVTSIGDYAFERCIDLTSVSLPDSLVSIGTGAFINCFSLTDVAIPESVESIGDSAFYSCLALTCAVIPDSVISIGEGAFNACHSLAQISVSPEHPVFSAVDGVLFDRTTGLLISFPAGHPASEYSIPAGTTAIGSSAFSYCQNLARVVIPDSVTSIGSGAFFAASVLSEVSIPDSIHSIEESTFCDCENLTNVVIPDSVTRIGPAAFFGCTSLTDVFIPDSVMSIDPEAFCGCESLTSLSIPGSVTSIGDWAFFECPDLILIVECGSFAEEYAAEEDLNYVYQDTRTSSDR